MKSINLHIPTWNCHGGARGGIGLTTTASGSAKDRNQVHPRKVSRVPVVTDKALATTHSAKKRQHQDPSYSKGVQMTAERVTGSRRKGQWCLNARKRQRTICEKKRKAGGVKIVQDTGETKEGW